MSDSVAVRDMRCSDIDKTNRVFTAVGFSDNTPDGILVV